MAQVRWKGSATPVAQVDSRTLGAPSVGSTYSVSCNNNTFTYTATSTNATTEAAAFVTAFNATTIAELLEATATASAAVISFTGRTRGKPFTFTYAAGGTGTPTFAGSTTVANSGPNNWDVAANWSTNTVPAAGDDVFIDLSLVPILYGLSQSGVTLNSLNIAAAYSGPNAAIGLPETNTSGGTSYKEYRPTYLTIGATTVVIGYGPGSGCGRIKLDAGTVPTTVNIYHSTAGLESATGVEAVQWKGTHASDVVNIVRGSLAIAGYGGDTSTLATVNVGFVSSPETDAKVRLGKGVTLTNLVMNGGQVEMGNGATTITQRAGTLTLDEGSVVTLTADGGTVQYNGVGTIGTLTLNGATFDCSEDMRSRTVTLLKMYARSAFLDPNGTVTFGGGTPIQLQRCRLTDVVLDLGVGRQLSVA